MMRGSDDVKLNVPRWLVWRASGPLVAGRCFIRRSYGVRSPTRLDFRQSRVIASRNSRIQEGRDAMYVSRTRHCVVAFLVSIWSILPGFGQEKAQPNQSTFQKTAECLISGGAMGIVAYGHFPHFTSSSKMKGGDIDEETRQRFERFPRQLIEALSERDTENKKEAIRFLYWYTAFVRGHAALQFDKRLSHSVENALSPNSQLFKQRLVEALKAKDTDTRRCAALALLGIDESHAQAREALRSIVATAKAEMLNDICSHIGRAQLAEPTMIRLLGQMLEHRDARVREAAAGAIITLGTSAREAVPALVRYLKTGKQAEGSYSYPFAIALPGTGNLALMALDALGEHAAPALPTILELFPKASARDQLAMLSCLASIQSKDDACVALIRGLFDSEDKKLKLTAACTLLHIVPGDRHATEIMQKAVRNNSTGKLAVEVCQDIGPPSPEIAATLLPMLDSAVEDIRIEATHALARIGPCAEIAVPAIEKLLAREEDGTTHTFLSLQAAAYALGRIRSKEATAALLRVADSKASGSQYSFEQVRHIRDEHVPRLLPVLVRALGKKEGPRDSAAIALSNLGERASPVRRDLERFVDDPEIGWIIDTALRRIPEKAR